MGGEGAFCVCLRMCVWFGLESKDTKRFVQASVRGGKGQSCGIGVVAFVHVVHVALFVCFDVSADVR